MVTISETGILLVIYAIINVLVFLVYGNDKRKAKKDLWRTSERTLLLLALLGPFGAYGAMKVFRHKTIKSNFRLVPVFVIVHLLLIAAFIVFAW